MIRFLWCMRPYLRQVAGELTLGSICGIVMNTAIVLPAILLGRAIDQVVALARGEGSSEAATVAALLFVAGTLATEVPRMGKRWWIQTSNARMRANVRADAFRGVLAWPMARLHRTPIGDVMARIVGDVEVLGLGLREFTTETWDTVLASISVLVAMVVIDPTLTALALLPVPFAMLLAHASGRWITGRTTASREANSELTTSIQENLAGLRVLRLFGRRASAIEQVAALSERQAQANLALNRLRSGLRPAYSTLMTAGVLLVVWLGGERVVAGALTLGAFVAYLDLFTRFVGRAFRIPQLLNSVQSGAAAYERLQPLLAPTAGVAGEPRFASFRHDQLVGLHRSVPTPPTPDSGPVAVTLRGATFSYPGTPDPAFHDVDLEIRAGAFVAVTGPVGCGKSAIARCLAGVYAPDAGDIWLDGRPAAEVGPFLVGYAPQEGYIFSGSLRDNILLGLGPATEDRVESLVQLAGLADEVASFPQGVETQVGELGVRISGGQRQRLGLARAAGARMPRFPGLLVLDDPFSAVDVDTEVRIVANLFATFGRDAPPEQRATIVLFSHRLAAFTHADLVVVLDRGRVVECGSHDDLVRAGGLYARIYRAQLRVERGLLDGALQR